MTQERIYEAGNESTSTLLKPVTARGSLFSARGRRGAGVKIAAGERIYRRNFLRRDVRKFQCRRTTYRNKDRVHWAGHVRPEVAEAAVRSPVASTVAALSAAKATVGNSQFSPPEPDAFLTDATHHLQPASRFKDTVRRTWISCSET